ncbi:sulfurtransferase [Demequina zhanjiangensis]|uniref:Sulfurtransferase n=1 Tax=Demequina zhanjiangensis TaxID=3051659 RepID=A0ABT8G3K8_9MICO|nr:sulfurtransferase [Demequina sp. SYSU T00b26]MDN4473514.1 sulfurtransferase [Demequina sp. SYSU T00b26]
MNVLVTVEELAAELAGENPPKVLDARWALTQPDGRDEFAEGHVPGAVYVDMETELATHGEPSEGRHPMPTRESLEESARAWGLDDGDRVVVMDGGPSFGAARAWWLLRHADVDVRILDGGYAAWVAAGQTVEAGATTPEPGSISLGWGVMGVIEADEAGDYDGLLLDARAGERYRGETEPMDPKAGHIPGAVNAPTTENAQPDGRFLDADALATRFAAIGAESGTTAVYCGSGVTAAHQIAAMEIAGITDVALYPGSWSAWSNQDRPVAVGPNP